MSEFKKPADYKPPVPPPPSADIQMLVRIEQVGLKGDFEKYLKSQTTWVDYRRLRKRYKLKK